MTKPRVCIVTKEFLGPFRNGGIGTATTGLALTLAAGGFPVTVLYTGAVWTPDVDLARWKKHYASLGIELAALSIEQMKSLGGPVRDCGFGVPWLVYEFLRMRHFDIVHFNECGGDGSLTIAAKHLGIAWERTLFVVGLHSPSQWFLELNGTIPTTPLLAAHNHAERLSVRYADVLWSPSRYMLDWAREHEFQFPGDAIVQQYTLALQPGNDRKRESTRPREIVFFGRLEERKGLRLFCDVIESLQAELIDARIAVTFLGKPGRCGRMYGDEYVHSRAREWRSPVRLLTDLDQSEALAHLAAGDRLAVMASQVDNSPCTVYEALECGIPFMATRTGGIPELIDADDRGGVLFDPTFDALRDALRQVLRHGVPVARPAVPQDETKRRWIALHERWESLLRERAPARDRAAPGAVAIVDHRSGDDLAQTIDSLERCDAIRRIVVLHRGAMPAVPSSRAPIHSIDLSRGGAPSLTELLDDLADDAVLLVQSGVRVRHDTLPKVIASLEERKIDGVVPAATARVGRSTRVLVPLGGSPSFSLHHGVTFTGGLVTRGAALHRALDGRQLLADAGFAGIPDLCVAGGAEVLPWPETLFEHTQPFVQRNPSRSPARIAAYSECSPAERYYMVAIGYSAASGNAAPGRLRELAVLFTELGFGRLVRGGIRVRKSVRRLRALVRSMTR